MPFFDLGADLKCLYISCHDLVDNNSSGQLLSWGANDLGRLGDNTIINRCIPIQSVAVGRDWRFVGGRFGGVAIKSNNTLWSWGYGGVGYLGNNSALSVSSPVQTVSGGSDWVMADTGAGIKQNGTLWNWGPNNNGNLGDGTLVAKSSPVQTVSGGNDWCFVRASLRNRLAIKTNGTLWTWGSNYYGILGTNDRINRSSPGQTIAGGSDWRTVCSGRYHAIAIKCNGSLWVWGMQQNPDVDLIGLKPVLGQGNTVLCILSPTQTITGGCDWKQATAGWTLSAAIKCNGTLWVWGHGLCGGLGTGNTNNASSPVQTIAGGNNWKQVSAAGSTVAAIKTDGTLWTWGSNAVGQLGIGNTVSRSSPGQVISGSTWTCVRSIWTSSACNSSVSAININ